jgi:hypothetical protein
VNVTIHAAPAFPRAPTRTRWKDSELIDQAETIIMKDLRAILEKDVMERIVGTELRRVFVDERNKKRAQLGVPMESKLGSDRRDLDSLERTGLHVATNLKGLSFRKEKPVAELPKTVVDASLDAPGVQTEDAENEERPRKKPKKSIVKLIPEDDIESEDDLLALVPASEIAPTRKRAASVLSETEDPTPKKAKKTTKKHKKQEENHLLDEVVHEVLPIPLDVPAMAQLDLVSTHTSSPSPHISPVQELKPLIPIVPISPAINPLEEGICEDDEDLYFVKLALTGVFPDRSSPPPLKPLEDQNAGPPPFRVHTTGSARSEGYYKISHAEKAAYVDQYANRNAVNDSTIAEEAPQPKTITSSRSNRANARRRAQGLEEINQVHRAMALSKGESAATELVKFNQLQTRKKHMRFARSPIHDWGLYAMEKISRGEMVIEYVGEVIRAQVADKREKAYERQGIGSSYLFRIDEDLVVDATKKGNLGYVPTRMVVRLGIDWSVSLGDSSTIPAILIAPRRSSRSTARKRSSFTRNKI